MEEINIGDVVTVYEAPIPWSSYLCNNSPTELTYPTTIEIVGISDDGWHRYPVLKGYHRESDKFYGFYWGSMRGVCIGKKTIRLNKELVKFLTQHV